MAVIDIKTRAQIGSTGLGHEDLSATEMALYISVPTDLAQHMEKTGSLQLPDFGLLAADLPDHLPTGGKLFRLAIDEKYVLIDDRYLDHDGSPHTVYVVYGPLGEHSVDVRILASSDFPEVRHNATALRDQGGQEPAQASICAPRHFAGTGWYREVVTVRAHRVRDDLRMDLDSPEFGSIQIDCKKGDWVVGTRGNPPAVIADPEFRRLFDKVDGDDFLYLMHTPILRARFIASSTMPFVEVRRADDASAAVQTIELVEFRSHYARTTEDGEFLSHLFKPLGEQHDLLVEALASYADLTVHRHLQDLATLAEVFADCPYPAIKTEGYQYLSRIGVSPEAAGFPDQRPPRVPKSISTIAISMFSRIGDPTRVNTFFQRLVDTTFFLDRKNQDLLRTVMRGFTDVPLEFMQILACPIDDTEAVALDVMDESIAHLEAQARLTLVKTNFHCTGMPPGYQADIRMFTLGRFGAMVLTDYNGRYLFVWSNTPMLAVIGGPSGPQKPSGVVQSV